MQGIFPSCISYPLIILTPMYRDRIAHICDRQITSYMFMPACLFLCCFLTLKEHLPLSVCTFGQFASILVHVGRYTCVCESLCTCVHVLHVCDSQRTTSGIVPQALCTLCSYLGILTGLELSKVASPSGKQALGINSEHQHPTPNAPTSTLFQMLQI